jgi:hypothetical protein
VKNALREDLSNRSTARLSTAILLDLYSRYVDDRVENLRSYAYEDFLLAHVSSSSATIWLYYCTP